MRAGKIVNVKSPITLISLVIGVLFAGVLAVGIFVVNASAASVNDFYFDSFEADYYLTRGEDGVSRMDVVENLTAVFPDYNQNKGICRKIPFTNHGGDNITLRNLDASNIVVLRNGASEPIYSIDKEKDYFNVCTGTDDYVLGKQVYTLKYSFERVVTDYENYQELYWDTNGTGWSQKFNTVVARVHFADEATKKVYDGNKWCYVGSYGESGQARCKISEISDGVEFSAEKIKAYENLTFDVQFNPGTFVVPEPERSYILLIMIGVIGVIAALLMAGTVKKYLAAGEKRKYYKGLFVKPEFQPNNNYSISEMTENYIGKKKDLKVALLLKMIVEGKIALKKRKGGVLGGNKWSMIIKNLDDLSKEEMIILEILNRGDTVEVGDEVEIEKQNSNYKLRSLGKSFDKAIENEIKSDGLVEPNYKIGGSTGSVSKGGTVAQFISGMIVGIVIGTPIFVFTLSFAQSLTPTGVILVGETVAFLAIIGICTMAFAVIFAMGSLTTIYEDHTKLGLEMSRYMDGLKLYIDMAEAERMKVLQSVKGADTSTEGIVRLYEKLLPYAAVFGSEDSWMAELEKYYKMEEVESGWYNSDLSCTDVLAASQLMSRNLTSSVAAAGGTIAGGGSLSSGFSGGGGGGFSGGGGGGGGGGGR